MAKKDNNKIILIGSGILILFWLYKKGMLNKLMPSGSGGGGGTTSAVAQATKQAVTKAVDQTNFAPEETSFKAMYEADINKCN